VIVQHRGAAWPRFLPEVLQRATRLPVVYAHSGQRLRPGHVYVASPDQHLVIRHDRTFGYVDGRKINFLRSSADPLFESAAEVYGAGTVGIVLTGYDRDGSAGASAIKARGGIVIAQTPETCEAPDMPKAAIGTGAVDMVLPVEEMAGELIKISRPQTEPSTGQCSQ
jgi:two-component system chemotaxis response regulator CheB